MLRVHVWALYAMCVYIFIYLFIYYHISSISVVPLSLEVIDLSENLMKNRAPQKNANMHICTAFSIHFLGSS